MAWVAVNPEVTPAWRAGSVISQTNGVRAPGSTKATGSDHNSGWWEDAESYDGVSLPDENFNYDEFIEEEFGSSPKPVAVKTVWWVTAILVLVVLVAIYLYAARG